MTLKNLKKRATWGRINALYSSLLLLPLQIEDVPGAQAALTRSLGLWLPQHLAWAARGEGEQTGLSYNTR